jgi:hypothetical protein
VTVRQYSASASASKKVAVAKTPLERMYQVTDLAARCRLIARLAGVRR